MEVKRNKTRVIALNVQTVVKEKNAFEQTTF